MFYWSRIIDWTTLLRSMADVSFQALSNFYSKFSVLFQFIPSDQYENHPFTEQKCARSHASKYFSLLDCPYNILLLPRKRYEKDVRQAEFSSNQVSVCWFFCFMFGSRFNRSMYAAKRPVLKNHRESWYLRTNLWRSWTVSKRWSVGCCGK